MKKRALIFSIIGAIFLLPFLALAQEARSYQYDKIDVQIQVNKDSTFDVTENQTYNYRGEYHQGWRSVSLNKVSAITDVQVIDGATDQPLKYSIGKLDKYNSANWGYYTNYKENGAQIIEWYYNLKDTTHVWIIKYKVHGGLGFYKDHDEVYWNLFTDYSVPVLKTTARVILPANNFSADQETAWLYWRISPNEPEQKTNQEPYVRKMMGGVYEFAVDTSIAPQGIVTIAAGWPKGLIEQKAFWWDWFCLNWPYFLSLLIILASIIYYTIYWYLAEKYHKGRGTIVPQYEPPQNLRPAMAELIATENISRQTWPATIVDLAVRGHIVIKEEEKRGEWYLLILISVILLILPIFSFSQFWLSLPTGSKEGYFFFVFGLFSLIPFVIYCFRAKNKNYLIERVKEPKEVVLLEDYENRFLTNLLDSWGKFSTSEIKYQPTRAQKLAASMDKLAYDLYRETDKDTKAYEIGLIKKRTLSFNLAGLVSAAIGFLVFFLGLGINTVFPAILPVAIMGLCFWLLVVLKKYNPRLNKDGFILKEEWLGFKMYLEKAERYRLQNLTPDLFEKYLPYAMIFGIEKKWAKNFDSLNMQAPTWYVSSAGGAGFTGSTVNGGEFSASAFSSSFSSSFASAFSSSGGGGSAGGGGGGGGGAGGGGGGGGGGAS